MMKDAGLRPNTYCMNSLMAVNVQARQPNTALEIFKEMERDGIPRDVVRARFFRVHTLVMIGCRGYNSGKYRALWTRPWLPLPHKLHSCSGSLALFDGSFLCWVRPAFLITTGVFKREILPACSWCDFR